MTRQEAVVALRKRFTNTDETVLPPGLSIISQEEAEALGVFKADGWVEWGGESNEDDLPEGVACQDRVDVRFRTGEINTAGDEAHAWCWDHDYVDSDIIAYRIHKDTE